MLTPLVLSSACNPKESLVCKRAGGCCISYWLYSSHFHPWCVPIKRDYCKLRLKGLITRRLDSLGDVNKRFYIKHEINSDSIQAVSADENETCEVDKGRNRQGFRHDNQQNPRKLPRASRINNFYSQPVQESDPWKQSKGLIVYKYGIQTLGL